MSDQWGRPPQQQPPFDPRTQQIPQRGQYPDPATQQFPRNPPQQPGPYPPQGSYPPPPQQPPIAPVGGDGQPPPKKKKRGLSIVLIIVIVLALLVAGVIGVELYARNEGNNRVATAAACLVEDGATASFGAMPPFLIQHLNEHYSSISIETAGNNIRQAKGMKAEIEIDDVQLTDGGDSKGTIGSLNATITWSGDGIRQTIEDSIPLIGSAVSDVKLNPSDGTVELGGGLAGVIVKPILKDDHIALEVVELTGLGFAIPTDTVQEGLDGFTDELNDNYPLDIKADSIEVTDDGIVAKFSTQDATIKSEGGNECLANL